MGLSRLWLILVIMLVRSHFSQNTTIRCNTEYEGDTCTRDGKEGICTLLKECPVIYKHVLIQQFPHCPCGYKNFEPVVCCPRRKEVAGRNSNASKSLFSEPYRVDHGAKARAKCKEYESMQFYSINTPINTTISTSTSPPTINISFTHETTKRPLRRLITKGVKVMDNEFTFMAAIGYNSTENDILWLCGGTLISKRFVVTAAHCTSNAIWGNAAWVRMGTKKLFNSLNKEDAKTYRIIERIRHPWYKQPSEYHDIALLKLESDVEFTFWIRPCCLPYSLPDVGINGNATAMGWGNTEWAGDSSNELLKITINLISHTECNRVYSKDNKLEFGIVNGWQICAGGDGKDTCQGDSGGPLVIPNKDYYSMYSLIGITSLGKFCGSITPGIYTNVYNYTSWIENIVWPDS